MEDWNSNHHVENDNMEDNNVDLFDKNGGFDQGEKGKYENNGYEFLTKGKEEDKVKTVNKENSDSTYSTKDVKVNKKRLAGSLDDLEQFLEEQLQRQIRIYDKKRKEAKAVGRVTFSKITKEQWHLLDDYMLAEEAVEETTKKLEETRAQQAEWLGKPSPAPQSDPTSDPSEEENA